VQERPWEEPTWNYVPHPYIKKTHLDFAKKVRAFCEAELIPFADMWDEKGTYPIELHRKAYKAGVYSYRWAEEWGGTPPEDYDYFHDLVFYDEISRTASGGLTTGLFLSFDISLPPILLVGSDYLKRKYAVDTIKGKTIMSLAISEPNAGSDVAQLRTTAVRKGNYYIVNGSKYFISSGCRASYYTTGVRTGSGTGMNGLSLLLIEKAYPGVSVTRMKTQGWLASNTAFITFKNVKVPVSNLIGREGQGFKYILHNFNHERWAMSAQSVRFARICLSEAVKWARHRKTFGKNLAEHQVIRHKIAEMARRVEACQLEVENIAWRMNELQGYGKELAGPIAFCKVNCTDCLEFCAKEASQIFGGRSYIRGGRASKVERIYREVRVMAIGGGSTEIMLDLACSQARL